MNIVSVGISSIGGGGGGDGGGGGGGGRGISILIVLIIAPLQIIRRQINNSNKQ